MQALSAIESQRRSLRIILFIIILATLPFYCVGIVLWVSAPAAPQRVLGPSTSTLPPLTRQVTVNPPPGIVASPSPLGGFVTVTRSPLINTPGQFVPPVLPPVVPLATRFLSATPPPLVITATVPGIIIPTLAPTLTPIPSLTPVPLTDTPIPPPPTNTPIPPPPTPTTPPLPDSDGDGITDNLDVCPFAPAPGTFDGCPAPTVPPPTDIFVPPTLDPLDPTPIPP